MDATCRRSTLALVACAAMSALPGAAQEFGTPFRSPDGTRVVRLALTRLAGSKGTPSLQIEYSMVGTSTEVLIRPYASSVAGSETTRYRVAWDPTGRRFAVLANELPASGKPSRVPQLPSGEYVLLGVDRVAAEAERTSALKDWAIDTWKATGAVTLPLREFDIGKPTREYAGRTGVVSRGARYIGHDRVRNLTTHPNTQNFVPGRLAVTPEIEVIARQRAPARRFEARVVRAQGPALVMAEGDTYLDQQWVILYMLPEERLVAPRLIWSQDGRYLLLVTAVSGQPGFARLPGDEGLEVFLLFDVDHWDGTIAPPASVIGMLDLVK